MLPPAPDSTAEEAGSPSLDVLGLTDPTRERTSWMDDKTAEQYAGEVLDVYNLCADIPQLSLENPRTQVVISALRNLLQAIFT